MTLLKCDTAATARASPDDTILKFAPLGTPNATRADSALERPFMAGDLLRPDQGWRTRAVEVAESVVVEIFGI